MERMCGKNPKASILLGGGGRGGGAEKGPFLLSPRIVPVLCILVKEQVLLGGRKIPPTDQDYTQKCRIVFHLEIRC